MMNKLFTAFLFLAFSVTSVGAAPLAPLNSGGPLAPSASGVADLSTATGVLAQSKGGTGLTAIGSANQLLSVNTAGTALTYVTGSTLSDEGADTWLGASGTDVGVPTRASDGGWSLAAPGAATMAIGGNVTDGVANNFLVVGAGPVLGQTSLISLGTTSNLVIGSATFTAKPTLVTAGTTTASINIPLGTAPTSPASGDVWNTSEGMYVQIGTTTVGPLSSTTGTVTSVTFTGDGTVLSNTPSSAVTTTGTVTAALANAGAGTMLGNYTGSAAAPTYSATPLLGLAGTTAGKLTLSGETSGTVELRTAAAAGTGTVFQFPSDNGTNDYILKTDGNGVTSWVANSGTSQWTTATNDIYYTTGHVGIGTTAPATLLHVNGIQTNGRNGGAGGEILFNGATSGSVDLKVAAAAGTGTIFQLPADNGTDGYVLQTNGSGITSWVAGSYTLPTATTSVLGGVKVDGTTVTIGTTGVISAVGGEATAVSVGTTTITGGTDTRALFDNAGKVGETALLTVGTNLLTLGTTTFPSGISIGTTGRAGYVNTQFGSTYSAVWALHPDSYDVVYDNTVIGDTYLDGTTTGGAVVAQFVQAYVEGTGSATSGAHAVAIKGEAAFAGEGSAHIDALVGVEGAIVLNATSSGTIDTATMFSGFTNFNSTTGTTITNLYGFHNSPLWSSLRTTITNYIDYPCQTIGAFGSGGAVTNKYCLYNYDANKIIYSAGLIRLAGSTSGTVDIKTAAVAGTSTIFQLPATNGTANYVLKTDGSGVTSWAQACLPSEIDGHANASPSAASLTCGATIYNYGQAAANVNITLPTAVANLTFVGDVGTAQAANYWRFTAADAGTMYLDGSATGKDYIQFSAPAVGNYLVCHTFKSGASTYSWTCRTGGGTTSTN